MPTPQARRPRPLRRHAGRAPDGADRRQAGAARDPLALRAPAAARGPARRRDREDEPRQAHQRAGQEADGEGAEGVLPQREDQGHPPGAGPQGRPLRRAGRAQGAGREGRHAEGRPREGRPGAQAARGDAAGLRRGDRLAQLHRLADGGALEEDLEGAARPRARRGDPRTPTTTASRRSRSGSSSSWRCASCRRRRRRRSSASSGRRASASRRWRRRSRARRAACSSACRWAACATRPRSAATAAPTSAPFRVRSSR